MFYFGLKSPPPCDSRSRRTIRSIHAATRHHRKTRCRVNRTVHPSGTRRLIRIMNAFEKRARKELRCGSRANYRFEAAAVHSFFSPCYCWVWKILRFFFWFVFVLLMVERIGVGWLVIEYRSSNSKNWVF